jgi:hypothetical protein
MSKPSTAPAPTPNRARRRHNLTTQEAAEYLNISVRLPEALLAVLIAVAPNLATIAVVVDPAVAVGGTLAWESGNTKGRGLFRVERVTADTQNVYVCEGEKDVLVAESEGVVAVCSPMGASNAGSADWSPLAFKDVTIVADHDTAGHIYANAITAIIDSTATSIRVVHGKNGNDLSGHVAAG